MVNIYIFAFNFLPQQPYRNLTSIKLVGFTKENGGKTGGEDGDTRGGPEIP